MKFLMIDKHLDLDVQITQPSFVTVNINVAREVHSRPIKLQYPRA